MREKMPVQGRWRGARAEHLLQYLMQELLKKYGRNIEKGKDLSKVDGFKNQFKQSKEPLPETAELFYSFMEED